MKIIVETTLNCGTAGTVELPINDWQEIKSYFIRWDTLHYTLDGENWHEIALNSDMEDIIEWKRPVSVTVLNDNLDVLSAKP